MTIGPISNSPFYSPNVPPQLAAAFAQFAQAFLNPHYASSPHKNYLNYINAFTHLSDMYEQYAGSLTKTQSAQMNQFFETFGALAAGGEVGLVGIQMLYHSEPNAAGTIFMSQLLQDASKIFPGTPL